jgi:acryloyl-coenzyme A reductase
MIVEDVEVPKIRGNEILVRVIACGVCYLDTIVRSGIMPKLKLPLILGHEISGEVVEVADCVQHVKVGDRVSSIIRHTCGHCKWCLEGRETLCTNSNGSFGVELNGGYAEYVKVPENSVCKIPQGIPLDMASIFSCTIGTALHTITKKAKVRPGETVLITGAGGGLGVHCIQIASLCGGKVIAVTTSEEKYSPLKEMGANDVIISKNLSFHKEVKKITDGAGVDVVIENVGSATLSSSLQSLAQGGRIVLIGELTGTSVQINPAHLVLKEVELLGSLNSTRRELQQVIELVEQEKIKPVVFSKLPLEGARDAHEMIYRKKPIGRVILTP